MLSSVSQTLHVTSEGVAQTINGFIVYRYSFTAFSTYDYIFGYFGMAYSIVCFFPFQLH